jgi:hypothetical protein
MIRGTIGESPRYDRLCKSAEILICFIELGFVKFYLRDWIFAEKKELRLLGEVTSRADSRAESFFILHKRLKLYCCLLFLVLNSNNFNSLKSFLLSLSEHWAKFFLSNSAMHLFRTCLS